jgi:tRNA-splicing ligase RtcB
MKYIDTEKHIIKSWCNEPEEGCLAQARNLANLPFIFKQVCLMPDTHQGYGMPIGGVIACENMVIPNAVGVDIGCGMRAIKTGLTEISIERIKVLMGKIREVVPLGFDHHKEKQSEDLMPQVEMGTIAKREFNKALCQIGTLGGGNHFIEIQRGSDGHVWIMIHSGSRNIGKQTADYHNKQAIELNERWFSSVPTKWELAFLPFDEARDYWTDMNYCLEFARLNRQLMVLRIKDLISADVLNEIDIHHNYAQFENHFGKNVIIHRKGATLAREGTIGIIPGSQGTCSYIVKGKGNPESFMSCSHGAGRRMGRGQAQRELSLENELKKMNDKGIVHGIRNQKYLDEAAGAYKDIDVVMEEQKDLVEILVKLEPLGVIKA